MAILHVLSTGSNTSPYETWAKAATTLVTAAAAAAAGDTIYVSNAHTETAAGQAIAFTNGTMAAPIHVVSGTPDATSGITAMTIGGEVKSSNTTFTITGTFDIYGMKFEGTSASATTMTVGNVGTATPYFEECTFTLSGTSSGSKFLFGYTSTGASFPLIRLRRCHFKTAQSGQHIAIEGTVNIEDCDWVSGTSQPASVFIIGAAGRGGRLLVSGMDFNNLSTSFDVFAVGGTTQFGSVRNSRMPASWTGDIFSALPSSGGTCWELLNYAIGTADTNYRFWTADARGQCREDITIYRTSGAADETPRNYSMRMQSSANVAYPGNSLRSLPISKRVTPGTVTATVHILHDGAAFVTDKEVWLEVEYLDTSGYPLSSIATSAAAFNVTASSLQNSGEAWTGDTGTGLNGTSTWNTTTVSLSGLVVAEAGYLIAHVRLAKPSWYIYVDPKIELS